MKKFIISFLILTSVILNLTSCSKKGFNEELSKCTCPTQYWRYSNSYTDPYEDIEKDLIQRQFNYNKEFSLEQINNYRNNIEFIEFLCTANDYGTITLIVIYKYHTCK